jgi:hypothetical protein
MPARRTGRKQPANMTKGRRSDPCLMHRSKNYFFFGAIIITI